MFRRVDMLGKNQFVVLFTDKIIFQSYDTVVAFIDKTDPHGRRLVLYTKEILKDYVKVFQFV